MPCYYPMLERKIRTHFADVAPLDMPEHGVKMALFIALSRFMFSDITMQDEDAKIKFLVALGHLWREKDLNETPKRLFEDEYFVSVDTVKLHIQEIFHCIPTPQQTLFVDNLATELCEYHSHISACLNYLKECETVGPDHTEYSETSWPLLESFPARRHCRNHDFDDWLCDSRDIQIFVDTLYVPNSIVWSRYYGSGMAERAAISEAGEDEYDDQMEALEHVSRLRDLQREVIDEMADEVVSEANEDEVVSEANEDEVEVEVEDEVEVEVEENNAEYDLSAQQDEEFAPESEDDEDYNEDEESEDEDEESEDEDEEDAEDEDEEDAEDEDDEFVSELDLAEISSIGTIDDNTDDELEYTLITRHVR